MRRFPWDILFALLLGLSLGFVYSWVVSPRRFTDAGPTALRADFKDQYRSVIAAAYAATGNLPRAQARLSLLGDSNSAEALNAQAQRMLAGSATGERFEHADQVAALALALDDEPGEAPISTPTVEVINEVDAGDTATPPPLLTEVPLEFTGTPFFEETPVTLETESAVTSIAPTARPTHTSTPEPGEPFALTGQESVCDVNLPDGLLQVLVLNRSRRQVAGIEIVITWDGGEEQFFTGLKPELGNGYADYIMSPDIAYTVQLAQGSDVALSVVAPTCQSPDGQTFFGSIKLTFQQP